MLQKLLHKSWTRHSGYCVGREEEGGEALVGEEHAWGCEQCKSWRFS